MMTVYKITLLVSVAHEKAIIDLYRKKRWHYMKIGHENLQLFRDQDSTPQASNKTLLTPTPERQGKSLSEKLRDGRISDVQQPEQSRCTVKVRNENLGTNPTPVSEMQRKSIYENHCDDGVSESIHLIESNCTLALGDEKSGNFEINGSLNYKKEQVKSRELSDHPFQEEINNAITQHEGEHAKQDDSNSTKSDNLGQSCEAAEKKLKKKILEIIKQTSADCLATSSNVKYGNDKEPVHMKEKDQGGKTKVKDARPRTERKYADIYCKNCEHTYKFRVTYEKHLREDRCRHQCDICGKVFKYSGGKGHDNYLRHMSYHYKQKDHECPVCGKRFIVRCEMKRHLKRHTEPKPIICDQCGDAFPTITAVKSHMNNVHIEKKERFACPKCPKVFTSKSGLYYHFKHNHDTEYTKTFPCSVCGKQFKERKLLKVHGAVHKETKDFKCGHCYSSFKLLNQLNTHKKRHFQAYSCFCKICNKGFYEPCTLRAHEMAHAGTKPHQCSVCEYRCTLKENLNKHEKIHKK